MPWTEEYHFKLCAGLLALKTLASFCLQFFKLGTTFIHTLTLSTHTPSDPATAQLGPQKLSFGEERTVCQLLTMIRKGEFWRRIPLIQLSTCNKSISKSPLVAVGCVFIRLSGKTAFLFVSKLNSPFSVSMWKMSLERHRELLQSQHPNTVSSLPWCWFIRVRSLEDGKIVGSLLGRQIRNLNRQHMPTGSSSVSWFSGVWVGLQSAGVTMCWSRGEVGSLEIWGRPRRQEMAVCSKELFDNVTIWGMLTFSPSLSYYKMLFLRAQDQKQATFPWLL